MTETQAPYKTRNRLMVIAEELGAAHRELNDKASRIIGVKWNLERRKLELTPEAGWEGKNEEARKIAAEKALAADWPYQELLGGLYNLEHETLLWDGTRQFLEAERRAWEWTIRAGMVRAITGYNCVDLTAEPEDDLLEQGVQGEIDELVVQETAWTESEGSK